jgi:hypothetical protein
LNRISIDSIAVEYPSIRIAAGDDNDRDPVKIDRLARNASFDREIRTSIWIWNGIAIWNEKDNEIEIETQIGYVNGNGNGNGNEENGSVTCH